MKIFKLSQKGQFTELIINNKNGTKTKTVFCLANMYHTHISNLQ